MTNAPRQPVKYRAVRPAACGQQLRHQRLANPAAAHTIVNWPEVAWAGLDRLRENARHTPFDPELHALVARAETALAGTPVPRQPAPR